MTLFHEIEAECERLAGCPDTEENAKLGITFRAVWWRQIKQEISGQADEIKRMRLDHLTSERQWVEKTGQLIEALKQSRTSAATLTMPSRRSWRELS